MADGAQPRQAEGGQNVSDHGLDGDGGEHSEADGKPQRDEKKVLDERNASKVDGFGGAGQPLGVQRLQQLKRWRLKKDERAHAKQGAAVLKGQGGGLAPAALPRDDAPADEPHEGALKKALSGPSGGVLLQVRQDAGAAVAGLGHEGEPDGERRG